MLQRVAFFGILMASLSFQTQAHTFGVGVRAGDSGGVEVWYRTWHGCGAPISEGQIKIEGIDGTNYGPVQADATLSSCDQEGGTSTFPVFEEPDIGYYCEVNAAGEIIDPSGVAEAPIPSLGFDPLSPVTDDRWENRETGSVGVILCNGDLYEEGGGDDKWHGSSFTGLSAGRYRVTYVECQDVDPATCDNGSDASADFNMDSLMVASVEIEVSRALAGGGGPSVPVPAMPFGALLGLVGLLGLFGLRRLRR